MVNPFILQATDAMTQIILGIHTLLLGTGGRGLKRAKLFKIDMEFFQDKPEARIWKLFKIKQRH